ncbi:hydantoinase B/oxoprolinase family protein [Leptolyngbya sp. FACHB-261]|nr:hydantoinase B/oxoprolinase family protein [Leptolyngbya sp. FACHB-261]
MDPIQLRVLISALNGLASEGLALFIQSARSSNIKERQDCSSALFDRSGNLVAQSESIPVHLGAMPEAVRAVIACQPQPGDVFVLNDPFCGGTHLPDVTLVSPIVSQNEICAYYCSRGHHSDIGGMAPGSMPAHSTDIFQEGLILPPVRLVQAGKPVEDLWRVLLANVRLPEVRRGDLQAQIASHRLAEDRFTALIAKYGLATLQQAMTETMAYAERRSRACIQALPDGVYRAEDRLEGDGQSEADIPLRLALTIQGDSLTADFRDCADQVAGNLNCPRSVACSAAYFAVRCLLSSDVPANAGVYRPVTVLTRPGSLVDAQAPAAVVAGNVETSQRLTDLMLACLSQAAGGWVAQGQGTMNNLIMGGSDGQGQAWAYYETIGGGGPATRSGPGLSCAQWAMTNTLNTPIEALEQTFPLRVERYEPRLGSGGQGQHRGGDGIVRSIRVLQPTYISLLTERRKYAPQGESGGQPGAVGVNALNGQPLAAKVSLNLQPGDLISIETPGGGGWGKAAD